MQAIDHEHVISAGSAKVIGPDFFELSGFTYERSFHHGCRIRVVLVELLDAIEGGGAQTEDRPGEARSASARQHGHRTSSANGCRPIEIAAGGVGRIIQWARTVSVSHRR